MHAGYCQSSEKPLQIILIVADDLGWKDVGFMGSRFYQTPNLDRLAKKSVVFTNAYANASNCAPSRASLLTGSLTPRHGIYTVGSSERGRSETRKLVPTPNRTDLDTAFVTLAELFQSAGYKTALMGKWHLSDDPRQHGFDIHKGGGKAGSPKTYFSPYQLKYLPDGPAGEELTDRLTTESIDFMANNKGNPFLLYIPYFAIHTPLQGKPGLVEKYKKQAAVDGQGTNPHYSALVENMDANVGRIMAGIDSLKLENVLLIFTSDNGGIAALSRQWPLRAGKGSYYEGGIRVPLLIYDKQAKIESAKIETPVQMIDLYPTVTARAGITIPAKVTRDGLSILSLMQKGSEEKFENREIFWHFPVYLENYQGIKDDSRDPLFRTRPGSAIRIGKWKLLQFFEDDVLELYDLENDPGERIDLAKVNVKQTATMLSALQKFQKKLNTPIPSQANPDYNPRFIPK
ncbi:sulfatase [Dyadobacter aurulentus]|uniref:sulfatase n=1 Tax=Dyadobacter sp. UC 10 TaxID=2605428 RepID=UPI001CECA7C1|nr:sulfatase [Dyadobacter sp. UC 10]